jgi:hypothetical protein
MARDQVSLTQVIIEVVVLVFAFLLWLGTNTDSVQAKQAAEDSGLRDIRTGGYAWFQCGDWKCTEFTATNSDGKKVSGAVGCGLILKGCTIRWSK